MVTPTIFHNNALTEVDGKLVQMGVKCAICGKTTYPATERCAYCGAAEIQPAKMSEIGIVYSYCIVRLPVGPYKPPMIGAYVDLPEGARIYAQIHAPEEEVKVGMKVALRTGVIWTAKDGTEITGYYYVPYVEGGADE